MQHNNALVIFCYWTSRVFALHIMFILLTITGGVVAGLAPATVTIAVMIRRYLNGAYHISFSEMWNCYKREFRRANKVTVFVILPALSLSWYVVHGLYLNNTVFIIALMLVPTIALLAVFAYSMLVMMSIYDVDSFKGLLSNAFYLLLNNKLNMLITALSLVLTSFIFITMPIFGLFFGLVPVLITTVSIYCYQNDLFSQGRILEIKNV